MNVAPPMGAPKAAPKLWIASDLMKETFPDPLWIVPKMLPAGLAMLAGRPKLGKSFLALQLAIALDAGGMFLGKSLAKAPSFYIALEDSPRRMQERLTGMAGAGCGVTFAFEWGALNGRGVSELEMAFQTGAKLVVVDTLSRAVGRVDWDNLAAVTGVMGQLQHLTLKYDACLLLVDHHRKGNGQESDVIDDVMGSTAKSAVADTVWGLYRKRGETGATLRITGRDCEQADFKMHFDPVTLCWQMDTATGGIAKGSVQHLILDALVDVGAMSLIELESYLRKDRSNLYHELAELCNQGVVAKIKNGRSVIYECVVTQSSQRTQQAQSSQQAQRAPGGCAP